MRVGATLPLLALLAAAPAAGQRASYEELQTFSAVLNLIRLNHVDSVSYTPLVRAAIEGALAEMDPHSSYVRRDIAEALIAARNGELATAGIELDGMRDVVTIRAVGPGSPAEKAGLLPGDRIIAVQDSSVAGLASHEVELLLAAARGVERRVDVERGDPESPERVRTSIRLERYTWPSIAAALMLPGDVGYVRFAVFDAGSASQLERAIERLQRDGMERLVLDMRGNPGGLLVEAVAAAGLFLPRQTVVFRTVGRKADTNEEYRTRSDGRFRSLPLVLIVDGSTASAAEALAGALQDHSRAAIVGHRTFGKALVQAPFPLPAGDALWLTIARVHTPQGRMIQRSYSGLTAAQYRAASDGLRRGGRDAGAQVSGGIEPEVYFEARPEPPAWWVTFGQRGLVVLAAQRARLPADTTPERAAWRAPLLAELKAVAIQEMGVEPALEPAQETAVIRRLTIAAVSLQQGDAAAAEYAARTDPEVLRAAKLLDERAPPR